MKFPDILRRWLNPASADSALDGEPEVVGSDPEESGSDFLDGEGDGPSILVLEWHMGMRELYASYLKQYHYKYRITGSVERARAELEAALPDLFILDHRPPQVQGFALAAEIKQPLPSLPVVLCTMHGDIAAYEEFKRSGSDLFLIKPVRKEELARAIKELLVKIPKVAAAPDGKEKEEAPQPETPMAPPPPIPSKKKPGRKRLSFIDDAEEMQRQLHESNQTREAFTKLKRISISQLQNEVRIAQMPDEVKKLVREEPEFFKKSFFEHLLKLKSKEHLYQLCLEIQEQGRKGNFYDLKTVKEKVAAYRFLEAPVVKTATGSDENPDGDNT